MIHPPRANRSDSGNSCGRRAGRRLQRHRRERRRSVPARKSARYVVIQGPTRIGRNNRIPASSRRSAATRTDKKYHGEQSLLVIGDENLIREFVTINRGTADGGGATRIGNSNWIMAYVHIAHDCVVGNNTVFSNNSTLAGHARDRRLHDPLRDSAPACCQFCRVQGCRTHFTQHALRGQRRRAAVRLDDGGRLRRDQRQQQRRAQAARPPPTERIAAIKRAYRALYVSKQPFEESRAVLAASAAEAPDNAHDARIHRAWTAAAGASSRIPRSGSSGSGVCGRQ